MKRYNIRFIRYILDKIHLNGGLDDSYLFIWLNK